MVKLVNRAFQGEEIIFYSISFTCFFFFFFLWARKILGKILISYREQSYRIERKKRERKEIRSRIIDLSLNGGGEELRGAGKICRNVFRVLLARLLIESNDLRAQCNRQLEIPSRPIGLPSALFHSVIFLLSFVLAEWYTHRAYTRDGRFHA